MVDVLTPLDDATTGYRYAGWWPASVAHVAGALNKPTLLMLSYVVDWRWGSYQRENLWYPNMESIRWRAMIEDWHYVIDEVKQALAKISTSR